MMYFLSSAHRTLGGGGGSSVLSTMLAGMSSGQWLEMTGGNRPTNMDAGLTDNTVSGDTESCIAFAGHSSYNPITNEVWGLGADHDSGGIGKFWRFDIATNAFLTPVTTTQGSHQYQQSVVNGTTGDYFLISVSHDVIKKWNGSTDFDDLHAMPYITHNNLVATAADWWPGKGVAWIDGNAQTCRIYNPTTDSWSTLGSTGSYAGVYHNVCAYSAVHDCLVHGGGNGGSAPANPLNGGYYLNTKIYRLDTGGTNTFIADAPYHLGINSGMSLEGDGAGEFIMIGNENSATGNNECWKVTSTGTLTHETDPPTTTLKVHRATNTTTCAIAPLGCMVFIDFDFTRSPKARMYVRKA